MKKVLIIVVCIFSPLFWRGAGGEVKAQIITTIAGNGTAGYSGDGGQATSAEIYAPSDISVDKWGNIYIVDNGNNIIRRISLSGIITTVAGNGIGGFSGDGGPANLAQINNARSIAIDTSGNIYIDDTGNYRIRKIDNSGVITTIAGNGTSTYSGDGGYATSATFGWSSGIGVDIIGNLYIADEVHSVVRKVDNLGFISTFAGIGNAGNSGDGGAASLAQLFSPTGVCTDKKGNVYIADENNNLIRKVNDSGIISTYAGNGSQGYSGDGGLATAAQFYTPYKVAIDKDGNLFVSDVFNSRIRFIDTLGIITTLAGNGISGFAGDGGPSLSAEFNTLAGLSLDKNNDLLISDFGNNRIRKVTNAASSINQFSNNIQLSIYPNPATEIINVVLLQAQNDNTTIQITDVMGNVVVTPSGFAISPAGERTIDVSKLQNGIYFIRVTWGNQSSTHKLVVNH